MIAPPARTAILTLASLLLAGAAAAAEPAGSPAHPASVDALVAAAKRAVTTIDMRAFRGVVVHPGNALIVDVREPAEYRAGHVPGAVNVPRGLLEFKLWPHVGGAAHPDYRRRLYVYCGVGSRAALAARTLKTLGFTRVTAVDMRIADWDAAGYPLDFQ